ncbi:MAG: biopolymer transporter ExbD [Desulfobulbaceae bacterium]|uniref:Biopolymer transporter ExbD n=1 Tax=Candidatus Desulfatifera sulfidica TaxID=2841691 RepID=A0A8J6N6N5_9BACT|nr:biopolymer transporter ExbD [Candidatus Desulfatifera sulfidica]
MKLARPSRPRARIEMMPLIDVVFLLLVVFIYTMLSMAVHRGLPVTLPTSSAVEIERDLPLSLTVRMDGMDLDGREVLLEELAAALADRTAGHDDPGLLLFAERDLSYQQLFTVLDQVKAAGITRISMQADLP